MKQWYTLYTKPNSEYIVAKNLEEKGVDIFLPEIESAKSSSGSHSTPLFPSYLFAHVDLETKAFSRIQWTPGLRRVIMFEGKPVPMPEKVIRELKAKVQEMNLFRKGELNPFRKGDPVRVKEGPFQDMMAIFDRPTSSKKRVQILLDVLGRLSRVQIDIGDLEAVSEQQEHNNPEKPPKRPRRTRGKGRYINSQ